MPRPPKLDAKTMRLTLIGKAGQEEKIEWFKRWCARNGREISEILYEKVEAHAKKHGYPEMHSQTSLDHADHPKLMALWMTCKWSNHVMVQGSFRCKTRRDPYQFYKTPNQCEGCKRYKEV